MSPVVQISAVSKRFGPVCAVDHISFDIHARDVFGLLGPDGAGKTTLLRMMAGVLQADAGTLQLYGRSMPSERRRVQHRIGYMPQRLGLYGDLTVEENIRYVADLYETPQSTLSARMEDLLEFARLTPFRNRQAQYLSGGMKQKLALVCTLIHGPDLLLLDEPTTGVDPVSRREFWRILTRLVADGLTICVSTPYMDEAERCSRVALLDQGRLLRLDTPSALKSALPLQLLELVARPLREARHALLGRPGVRSVQVFGDRLHLAVDDTDAVMKAAPQWMAEAGLKLDSLQPIEPSLEDLFVGLIAQAREEEATSCPTSR